MTEYIEREAAKKVAERYGCKNGSALGRHSGLADCIAEEIAKLPPADVAPIWHGRWEKSGKHEWRCSVCNVGVPYSYTGFCYCPNCGARMNNA